MSHPSYSRADLLASDQTMIDGINKNLALLPASFRVNKQQVTPQIVVTTLQGRITTGKAVIEAETAHTAAVQADKDERAQTKPVIDGFKRIVIGMFANEPGVLKDMGLSAPRPAEKSAATKAKAAEKAQQTRKAVGTKGTKQKKAAIAAEHAAQASTAPAEAPATAAAPVAQPATAPKPQS
ncbi:MAG TPA: hypothetical protein VF765_36590 [Polyangiaceae bacterium]